MRFDGMLKSWNDERGFGFLEPLQGGEDIFVHIKAIRVQLGRPQVGQAMSFEIELGPEGRKRAKNVELLKPGRILRAKPKPWMSPTLQTAVLTLSLFVILYLVVTFLWRPPIVIAAFYVVASLVTYIVYARDKAAAQRNDRRTPESTLHVLALTGGWPGALIAQEVLRHKCTKAEFRRDFWATVVLNVVVFVLLCSPIRATLLRALSE